VYKLETDMELNNYKNLSALRIQKQQVYS